MSFYRITDPEKRDALVAEYTATVKRLRKRNLEERMGNLAQREQLEEQYRPIIESNQEASSNITSELRPIAKEVSDLNENLKIERQQQQQLGKRKYTERERVQDRYYGLQEQPNGEFRIGNKQIQIDEDRNITIEDGGETYTGTPGLWALIIYNKPNDNDYTKEDWENYKKLVRETDLINTPTNLSQFSRPRQTNKFKLLQKAIEDTDDDADDVESEDTDEQSPMKKKTEGSGVIFLPGTIKALTEKLKLLIGEYSAGNTTTRNEIVSILDVLRKRKLMTEKEYTTINNLLQPPS